MYVPDTVSTSGATGLPVLGPEPEITQLYSTKSGAKRIFADAKVRTLVCEKPQITIEYEQKMMLKKAKVQAMHANLVTIPHCNALV